MKQFQFDTYGTLAEFTCENITTDKHGSDFSLYIVIVRQVVCYKMSQVLELRNKL